MDSQPDLLTDVDDTSPQAAAQMEAIEQQFLDQIDQAAAAAPRTGASAAPPAETLAASMPDSRNESPDPSSSSGVSVVSEHEGSTPPPPLPLPPQGAALFQGQARSSSAGNLCVAVRQALHIIGAPEVEALGNPRIATAAYWDTIAQRAPLVTIRMPLQQPSGGPAGFLFLLRYVPQEAPTEHPQLGEGD